MGPLLVLLALIGVGYGAVAWERSHPIYLTVKGISVKFVSNQTGTGTSNWNMTLENNGTLTTILGQICQRSVETNICNAVGPVFWGNPNASDFYLTPGESEVFKLVGVNASYPIWELHFQLFPWAKTAPPSDQEVIDAMNDLPPEAEWLFYNSTSGAFIQ